jgi:hypothetical protein
LEQSRQLAAQKRMRELHAALIDVGNVLRLHHLREEEILQDLFSVLDDWGMTCVATMVEEHRQLHETLRVVSTTTDEQRATMGELVDRILAPMEEESASARNRSPTLRRCAISWRTAGFVQWSSSTRSATLASSRPSY